MYKLYANLKFLPNKKNISMNRHLFKLSSRVWSKITIIAYFFYLVQVCKE